jgi:hypothetical protein
MPPQLSVSYANGVLTVTLSNPPATGGPTGVAVSLGGQNVSLPLVNSQASLAVSVHPSLSMASIPALVQATGQSSTSPPIAPAGTNLGNYAGPVVPYQVVPPSASGQPYWVYPTQRATLRAYHLGISDPEQYLDALTGAIQDVYTVLSVLTHFLGKHVIPALTASTWSPVTLDSNEQNAANDLAANVLPNLAATLGTIYPSGGTRVEPYAELVGRVSRYQQEIQAYMQDVATIPNLT